MTKEQLVALLAKKTTEIDCDGRTVAQAIFDTDSKIVKEAVVEFIYTTKGI